jgi:hypothetical protein
MTDHFDMPVQHCPCCGYRFEAATRIKGDGPPDPDSVTLCLKCGAVLGWDYAMRIHRLTAQEIRELPTDIFQTVARAQQLIFTVKAERN